MTLREIIKIKSLSASLGGRNILSDISFNVYDKEITVILGRSGAGKSVLLKHLLGLMDIQEGEVVIFGKDIAEMQEEEQKRLYFQMGVFYQNGGLLNALTVGENIALPLEQNSNLSHELIDHIVWSKLKLVNLLNAYYLYPSQLSGGMLKRAALARAIVMDPLLLFCDEPGAGLDPISLVSLDKLILNLREQLGMSIVVVTHEVSSIFRIADRIVFIDSGQVVFQGTLEEALQAQNKQVKNYFDTAK
ncbi:ATP-binding cassette domain-containing protein [Carboxylicivirga sp. N1Y132]|uniref:ATP-binding cassette domain-containing protein n=1 Tax=Carboxylicivirga marina TaxID=2800988 RepID=A0ABS1HEM5_9BACT|nr:ATP-binding cassette domain-containing protein [Carboxylicivirga marina]